MSGAHSRGAPATTRSWALLLLLLAPPATSGCSSDGLSASTARDAGRARAEDAGAEDAAAGLPGRDASAPAPADAGLGPDSASPADATPADQGVGAPQDGGPGRPDAAVVPDAGPVSCGPLAGPGIEVCETNALWCALVFDDGSGCAASCARAGLSCLESYDDAPDCQPDTTRPALGCAATGHGSDYCLCGHPGTTPPPPPPPDPCSAAALLSERAGFGRNAEGGDPNNVYRVTTLSGDDQAGSLRRALESTQDYWVKFDVDGTITFEDPIDVRSNKTIDGRGHDITLRGTLRIDEAHDIIINDVRAMNDLTPACGQSGDVFVLSGPGGPDPSDFVTRDIWLHHVELFNGGDGLLDLRGATGVTVSWTHFHTHNKGLLMWADSNNQPAGGMQVTMHHNFFDRLTLRGPQFIFGKMHYVNNYQFEWFEYGAGCLGGAECVSENNIFQARSGCTYCQDPNPCGDAEWFPDFSQAFVNEWAGNGIGYIRSSGDLLLGGATIAVNEPARVFDPAASYAFVAEPASQQLADRIRAEAGPRTTLACP